jgi:hypothetical protein
MRKLTIVAAVFAAAAPLPALAQDVPADESIEESAARLSDKLSNRETQERLSQSVATMSEALLDLPLAPFLRAAAEMAGEDPESVDPDTTLRQMSPESERVPGEIADKLPRMMGAMAGMADGMGAMMPALREMAERMEEAVRRVELPEG